MTNTQITAREIDETTTQLANLEADIEHAELWHDDDIAFRLYPVRARLEAYLDQLLAAQRDELNAMLVAEYDAAREREQCRGYARSTIRRLIAA